MRIPPRGSDDSRPETQRGKVTAPPPTNVQPTLPSPPRARSAKASPALSLPGANPRHVRGRGRHGPRVARPRTPLGPWAARRVPWACAGPESSPRGPASAQTVHGRGPPRPAPPSPPSLRRPRRPLRPGSRGRRFPPGSRMGQDWNPACPARGRKGGREGVARGLRQGERCSPGRPHWLTGS